jgi:hypothetical protein
VVRLVHVSCPPEVFVEELGQAFGIALNESQGSRFGSLDDLHRRAYAHQPATTEVSQPWCADPFEA